MQITIVIVNWNACALLARCLDTAVLASRNLLTEIFVVDNGSTDGSPALVRTRFPHVHLLENPANLGFARANNRAIRLSTGEFVLLLNTDAFLTPAALSEMLTVMQARPGVGILGPRLVYADGTPQPSFGPLPTLRSEIAALFGVDRRLSPAPMPSRKKKFSGEKPSGSHVQAGFVSGACLLARRSLLDEIGLLDESFFFFSEEIDLCRRARRAGWDVVYLPSVEVVHLEGGSTASGTRRVLQLYRAKLQYFDKHHGPAARRFLQASMLAAVLFKTLAHAPRDPARAAHWRTVLLHLPRLWPPAQPLLPSAAAGRQPTADSR